MAINRLIIGLFLLLASFAISELSLARPHASHLFCESYPDSPHCSGRAISCAFCHNAVPPQLNSFGRCLQADLKNRNFPEDVDGMKSWVEASFDEDCDGDGFTVAQEIFKGTLPGDPQSYPVDRSCVNSARSGGKDQYLKICDYDHDLVYRKVWLDVCGEPPSFAEYEIFQSLPDQAKPHVIKDLMDTCLSSENWIGKDGVVWEIGHYKIRPVGSVKAGEDAGILPIVDYYADYQLFVYSQINGHDARKQLLADFTVNRTGGNGQPTQYIRQAPQRLLDGQVMQPERRVGLLTSFWNLGFYLNYTGIARVLVAQALRAYAGIELDQMQGLNPPPEDESLFRDYDQKGVTRAECAACHSTVDPMAYPFRNYNGLTGTSAVLQGQNASGLSSVENLGDEHNLTPLSYSNPRMAYFEQDTPGMSEMPEAGYLFGQRVENLWEWAEVLVNSDQFAANTVLDYWRVLIGHDPRPEEHQEYTQLWQDFKTIHNYSVETMLHDLIRTKAYGAP